MALHFLRMLTDVYGPAVTSFERRCAASTAPSKLRSTLSVRRATRNEVRSRRET